MAFVFIATVYKNTTRFGTFLADFNQQFRAGTHTGAARSTFIFVHFGYFGDRVYFDGIEFARHFAVAKSEAAPRAACFAAIKVVGNKTVFYTIVFVHARTIIAGSAAANHSHSRSCDSHCFSKYGSYSLHGIVSAYGTVKSVERIGAYTSIGKAATARKTATSTVGRRERSLYFVDTRILVYIEFFGYKIKNNGRCSTHYSQCE